MRTLSRISSLLLLTFLLSFNSSAQCDEKVREAFGGTAAIALYNTYSAIGALGDAYQNEVYSADEIIVFMEEQASMIDVLVTMLNNASASRDLPTEDKNTVKEIVTCVQILKKQAESLRDYASTGEQVYADNFQTYRTQSWEMISKLLGLE